MPRGKTERRRWQHLPSLQRRKADIGWAAGLLDGESTLRLQGGTPIVKVDMVNRPTLERLALIFGGRVRPNSGGRGSARQIHRWQVCGERARATLSAVQAYLVEKATQAALLLSVPPGRRGRRLTPEVRATRAEVRRQLSKEKRLEWR